MIHVANPIQFSVVSTSIVPTDDPPSNQSNIPGYPITAFEPLHHNYCKSNVAADMFPLPSCCWSISFMVIFHRCSTKVKIACIGVYLIADMTSHPLESVCIKAGCCK
ncbi:predicted protein [Lichtheimia corymbifera JMRC:FSU:9682]|uniref:Uncharacterized protein n=1 Tax=Lichtheimia corymbifera JMRC:FSU:9682 TaxID=1263082 RepID=A0A068SI71_9FUNG|nr:predicted protein [Lichtheimia corymbifera JMRC:FSU:9682]